MAQFAAIGTLISSLASVASTVYTMTSSDDSSLKTTDTSESDSKSITAAAYAQAESLKKRKGAASTVLTSPLGVGDLSQNTAKTTLGA